MLPARPMCDVIKVLFVFDVVFGLICPLLAVAPTYEFDIHLYQQNISWLQCPEGWTNFGITCFKVITDKASFEEAEINCQSYGGHLVHIDRLNKNQVLGQRSLDAGVKEAIWIGFWREVTGTYQWTNNRIGDTNLAFWLPGQPEIQYDDLKLCTYMIINSGTSQYRWVLDRCETKKAFICETEACVVGDFRCESGQCVSPQWQCDGKQDCTDGSDEQNCGQETCGGFISDIQIRYPEKPPYQPWSNCQWKIRAQIGYKVKLEITFLDTEPVYDVVGIYDGLSTQAKLLGNYSGSNIPPEITSTTNFLLVTFTADHSVGKTGFRANWSAVLSLCDSSLKTLEADNKIKWVTSPGYPERYTDNLQCSWIIRAAREEHVTLQVIDVDLLPSDWLEIRDGASSESTLIRRYSGQMQNEVLVSSGKHFYLHLHTDLQDSGTGFNISYHSGCDVTIFQGYGRISSPGFHAGKRYPNNLQCSWTLQDVDNRPSSLTFDFFHTEISYDFVQIYNDTTISSQTLLMNLSGWHAVLQPLTTPSGHFVIHFQTDTLVNKAGWSASFSFDCHDNSTLPDNLFVTSSSAQYQSYIRYSCDKGYQLEGTSKRFCDMGGVWNSTVPVCKLINCGPPHPLENGVLLNITSRNYDGVAYYRCNPGHGNTDIDFKVTCLEQGWVEMPACNPMECPKLKVVPNGRIYSPYLYHIHARANFKCHSGYRIEGHMTSECKHGGQWSRPEPICVPINTTLCAEVKVIHGKVNQTGPVTIGETIHITCKQGFQLYPDTVDTVTCMESGLFDRDPPQCTDIDECQDKICGSQHKCHNTVGSFWCECSEGYQHSTLDDPTCKDINECSINNGTCDENCLNTEGGYECSCNGVSRLYTGNQTQIINRRLLVPDHSCYVVCENQSIERSEQLIYTTMPLPDGSYLYPTSLHIICPHGALPDGPAQLTCQQDGTWSANVSKCIVHQCDDLDSIGNGNIVYTSNKEAGSFANYTCHPGYNLHGNRSRFCLAEVDNKGGFTLTWTGEPPMCIAIDCQAPLPIKHGNVSYVSTKLNNVAIYSCNHGYRLVGLRYRVYCLFSGLWSTDVILCIAQTCPKLQPPTAGSLTSSNTWYGVGTVVSFTCNEGYQLSDKFPLLCHIPEPFDDDVASTSLPSLEFQVHLTVYSSETRAKLEQNCSLHFSQVLHSRLSILVQRLILHNTCAWPADAQMETFHQGIVINTINQTTHEVIIKKKVHIHPVHSLLPSPVRREENCIQILDSRDVMYIHNNSVCERTLTSKLEIVEPVLFCKDGVPFEQEDVTFCINVKQDTAQQDTLTPKTNLTEHYKAYKEPSEQVDKTTTKDILPENVIPVTNASSNLNDMISGIDDSPSTKNSAASLTNNLTNTETSQNSTSHKRRKMSSNVHGILDRDDPVTMKLMGSSLSSSYSREGLSQTQELDLADRHTDYKTSLLSQPVKTIIRSDSEHTGTSIASSIEPALNTLSCKDGCVISESFSRGNQSYASHRENKLAVTQTTGIPDMTNRDSSQSQIVSSYQMTNNVDINQHGQISSAVSSTVEPTLADSSQVPNGNDAEVDNRMGSNIHTKRNIVDSTLSDTPELIKEQVGMETDFILNYMSHAASGIVTKPPTMAVDIAMSIDPSGSYKADVIESARSIDISNSIVQVTSSSVDNSKVRSSDSIDTFHLTYQQQKVDASTNLQIQTSMTDAFITCSTSPVKHSGASLFTSFVQSISVSPTNTMLERRLDQNGHRVKSSFELPQIDVSNYIQPSFKHDSVPISDSLVNVSMSSSNILDTDKNYFKSTIINKQQLNSKNNLPWNTSTIAQRDHFADKNILKEAFGITKDLSSVEMSREGDPSLDLQAYNDYKRVDNLATSGLEIITSIPSLETITHSVLLTKKHVTETEFVPIHPENIASSRSVDYQKDEPHIVDTLQSQSGQQDTSPSIKPSFLPSSFYSGSSLADEVTDAVTPVNPSVLPTPHTCSCDQISLPTGLKPGPVVMIQVNFVLRVTTRVPTNCSTRLREQVGLGVIEMLTSMRLDEKCPGLPNIVLTNTSGSLRIENTKIDVRIPFFLHDNTAPFKEVQDCGVTVQKAMNTTFKEIIHSIIHKLSKECQNVSLSFSDNDFTAPSVLEICPEQFEFDNSSNKCVWCDSCGSMNTTTTVSTTSTPTPTTSPSSTTQTTQTTSVSSTKRPDFTSGTSSKHTESTTEATTTAEITSSSVRTTSSPLTSSSTTVITTSPAVSTKPSSTESTSFSTTGTTISETSVTRSLQSSTTDSGIQSTSSSVLTQSTLPITSTETTSLGEISTRSTLPTTSGQQESTTTSTTTTAESKPQTTSLLTTTTVESTPPTTKAKSTPTITSLLMTTTKPTTTPSLAVCTSRSDIGNVSAVPELDLSIRQHVYRLKSVIQIEELVTVCLDYYKDQMKELIKAQEVKINLFPKIKEKCSDQGIYVRYVNLQLSLVGNDITMGIGASFTKIANHQGSFTLSTISACLGRLLSLPEWTQVRCLCYSSILESELSQCKSIPLTYVLAYAGDSKECNQGWSYISDTCIQDTPATTTTSSTTTVSTTTTPTTTVTSPSTAVSTTETTSSTASMGTPTSTTLQTTPETTSANITTSPKTTLMSTTEAVSMTTTSADLVEETTMAGMHECFICDTDKATSNEDCVNTFVSCTMENPVCKTEVYYTGRSGQYTLTKGCESQDKCENTRRNAVELCDRSFSNPYCVYCCNTSKCNHDIELLTFKGRKKRSTGDDVPTVTAQWNNTIPVCRDQQSPVFINCPADVIIVNDSKLPVSVKVPMPSAVDNSGLKPALHISPSNFTIPYWVYQSTNITFTATDEAGLVAECVIRIHIKDVTPPSLKCPSEVIKIYRNTTERTIQVNYNNIAEYNLSAIVDLKDVMKTSLVPDISDSVNVLEEFLVTLAVWDHANNSATCSFLMMYIPLGCPLWTLGSPLNVDITWSSSSTVQVECVKHSVMVHSPNSPADMEYTCQRHAAWTPSDFIPDCISEDENICPEWVYNMSWTVSPNSFMSIQPQCDITERLASQIQLVLDTLNVDTHILLIRNTTQNGIITIMSTFKMTSKDISSATCPLLKEVQRGLNNLNVSGECQWSASLTNATILGVQMDCASGLALVENNQEDGMCWPCPRGMAAKTAVCELCPLGTYRDNLTSSDCSPCPANRSTKNNGSMSPSDCRELCAPGWFSPSGLSPCIKCQHGTYQPGTGSKTCQSCDHGFGTPHSGSTRWSECKAQCVENEYSDTGYQPCSPCPYGYYNNQTQSIRCFRCTEVSASITSCSGTCGSLQCGDHGSCVSIGQGHMCHCFPTYTGEQCDIPVSQCDSVLCQNGGTCSETMNGFVCACTPGHTGTLCESDVDACYSSPCLYGFCHNNPDSFSCQCYDGYIGKLCDDREDHCVDHKCQHGQCINMIDGYVCNCTGTSYYGDNCETMQEYCQEGSCLNGGRCINVQEGFHCSCPSGYEGLVCEERQDQCTETSCLNGGQCVTDITGTMYCVCKSGYRGDKCQLDDQVCQVNPCQNQATCVQYPDKYICQCTQGFTGENCDSELRIGCEDKPCNLTNSLECLSTDAGYICVCKPGWTGIRCEATDDFCQSSPCLQSGTCENHGTHFTCVCPLGYAGNHCQDDIDECKSNPCMNGGVCQDQPGGYSCECTDHFYGDTCHMEKDGCVSSPCVHGTCLDTIEGYHCSCSSDWTGSHCDEAINKCLSLPCENGGTCSQNGTEFSCTCHPKYTGPFCELELTPCDPNPCVNGGTCTGTDLTFTCTCPFGFHGDLCDLIVNGCDSVQCEHSGTCIEDGSVGRCECTSLYTGKHCEKEKSGNFDMTVSGDVSVVCETELVLVELTALTLCLTYRFAPAVDSTAYSNGLILKMINESNETLLAVKADRLEISLWNDGIVEVVEFGQLGLSWHQVCLTWASVTGQLSVYLDQQLKDQLDNYGTDRKLSKFKISTRQNSTLMFQGQITGVNVYKTVLNLADLDPCGHGDGGDVISWVMFDQCRSEREGFHVTYPSTCPSDHCLPGYKGKQCNTLIDKEPPTVEYCPEDIVSVITVDELRTVVTWSEPVFYDNTSIVHINQTYYSGDMFTYGEYQVIYMAFDADDNHAVCLFHVIVTPRHCKIPPHPLNGQRSCDAQGHSFKHCSISCLDPSRYKFTEEPAQLYICREGGVWDPPRGKQFTFPPCAGYAAPSQSYQGVILLKAQTCSEATKLDLIYKLHQQFHQTGLCDTIDCHPSSVIVDCVTVNSRKRSAELVQYKVTFSIPSPSESTANSTSITDSFEHFVKEGIVNYTVEGFTMEVQLQCESGQVLSADKESCVNCGKGYYFSSDSRQCELCPLGSYSAEERQTSCISCGNRQTTLTEGAISQEKCFYICEAGYYLLDGECEPCEIGYYEDTTGSIQCKPCRLGYTTLTNASTHVSQCFFPCDMIGYTMSSEGSCVPCPRGWYKAERFEVTCRPCPPGFTTLTVGAGTESLCTLVVCEPGTWRIEDNECEPCSVGTYQNEAGQDFCHRCPTGHTTSQTGAQSVETCIPGEVNECLLHTDDCPDSSVCNDNKDSFECECLLGYTKTQDGSCKDNCLDVCIHGDCEYDSEGNPVCKCHENYEGLKCDKETSGLSAGSIIGICVAVLITVFLLVFFVFVCLRQSGNGKGADRQLLRFPIHRTDLRSSFRAIALAMNPFESSTERTMSSVLKGNRQKSKNSNTGVSENFSNKSSSPSKTSYF